MIVRPVSRPRWRRVLVGAVIISVSVIGPASAKPSPPDVRARLSEVASLYGVYGAVAARVVDTSRVGAAGRVLGTVIPGRRRPIVVFVLGGRTPSGPVPHTAFPAGPQRDAVVSGAIDARTGDVLAVRRSERAPDLGALGAIHGVHLTRRAGPPQVVGGVTFDTALTRLVAAGYRVSVPHFPTLAAVPPVAPQLRQLFVNEALPVGHRTVTLRLLPVLTALGSPVAGGGPTTVAVPSLVGMPFQRIFNALPAGLYLRVKRIGPLSAAASIRGLDALVVSAQEPAAGTQVPTWGVPIPHGVHLGPSVVSVTLAARGPGGA
jgi:hypothetical protein